MLEFILDIVTDAFIWTCDWRHWWFWLILILLIIATIVIVNYL